jgi:hypothetical protein
MNMKILAATAVVFLALPFAASAQGVVGGAAEGAHEGNHAAGPVGAVVGGAAGAAVGGVAGLLGVDQQPRFRAYVKHENRSSYSYDRAVAVGAQLPIAGVKYYQIPSEYGVKDYRYTIVNDQTVLVDPRTNRIVEIIN